MSSLDPSPSTPVSPPAESSDNTSVILTDTVMASVIRESVRRHVPVPQVVAERRHEVERPGSNELPRPMTAPVPVRRSRWSWCLRWFRGK